MYFYRLLACKKNVIPSNSLPSTVGVQKIRKSGFSPLKIRNFLALKVTISYKIISKWLHFTPLSKSFFQHHNIFPICKLFQFMF